MTYTQKTIKQKDGIRVFIFGTFIFLIVFFVFFYIYFLNKGVIEIVDSKENLKSLGFLEREYKALEQLYLDGTKKISLDHAYSLGFVDAPSPKFVLRKVGVARAEASLVNN